MNRAGRSDPIGPATTPHASSGWSRRACATISWYVPCSMVSTAPRYGAGCRPPANQGVGPVCGLPAVVDLRADQLVVHGLDDLQLAFGERAEGRGADVAGDLLGVAGAGDDDRDAGLVEDPAERE